MNILVTGGCGYLGSSLISSLADSHQGTIFVIDHSLPTNTTTTSTIKYFSFCLLDKKTLSHFFNTHSIDLVIHLAAKTMRTDESNQNEIHYQHNVYATKNLLEVMSIYNVDRLIFASTAAIYGHPQYLPIDTDHLIQPLGTYAQTKYQAEQLIQEYAQRYSLHYLILRIFNIAGFCSNLKCYRTHNMKSYLIPEIIKSLVQKQKITIYGNKHPTLDGFAVRDYLHIADFLQACRQGLQYLYSKDTSAILNIGSGKGFSVEQVITLAANITKNEPRVSIVNSRSQDPYSLVADISKTTKLLSWKPTLSLQSIVEDTYRFSSALL